MDPISNSIASLLNALQATSAAQAEVPVPQLPALLARVGQELSLTLLASADGSSQLATI